jgi:hypothetical protein
MYKQVCKSTGQIVGNAANIICTYWCWYFDTILILKIGYNKADVHYSLFGAGLHGKNWINPPISKHIWSTFATPRLIYATEILQLKDSDIKRLVLFQTKTLKPLQWLVFVRGLVSTSSAVGRSYCSKSFRTRENQLVLFISWIPIWRCAIWN